MEQKKIAFDAVLTCTITKDNPDFKYVNDENKVLKFNDTYYFKEEVVKNNSKEAIKNHIKNDLMFVAGGGYDTKGVNVLNITVKTITDILI